MLLIGGNHELYVDSVVEYVQRPGGFIDWWGGRYLTSNIHKTSDGTPLGKRYKVLHGKNANVLVFGFIYSKFVSIKIFLSGGFAKYVMNGIGFRCCRYFVRCVCVCVCVCGFAFAFA